MVSTMNINRLKQLEKKLSKKLVEYSTPEPGVYFVMKWQNERFERVEATKEEAEKFNRELNEALDAVYLPEEESNI